jgi:hypothetical protein
LAGPAHARTVRRPDIQANRPPHSEIRCADDRARLPGSTRRGRKL